MATLDTLDSERRAYAEEISEERRQHVTLQGQVRAARAQRAAMEAERDSLREAVLHLIEKGTFITKKETSPDIAYSSRGVQRLQSLAPQRSHINQSGWLVFPFPFCFRVIASYL